MPRILYEEKDFNDMVATHHSQLLKMGTFSARKDFCDSLKYRANRVVEEPPHHLWYGWAIMEAFQAGAAYALEQLGKSND